VGSNADRSLEPETAHSEFAATVSEPPPGEAAPDAGVDSGEPSQPVEDVASQPTLAHIGRYALKRRLGEGGLGTVHEAWDPLLSRTVAVKTLHFEVDGSARLALDRLFLNEARAAAGLNHAHIVTVYDAGLSAQGVYIAMERLRGRDLRQALAAGWRPTPGQAALLVRRVADALAYAHARGVVHCDIKPANIFLTRKDRPTVLDFGIARVAHRAAAPAIEGMVAGSPHYLAPEQLQGGEIDGRTDVYALGVVLYELLTGRKAFDGGSVEQITSAVLHNHPPPVDQLRPGVPAGLAAVVARAMARDPDQRFAGAAEMAQALRPWQERGADAAAERAAGVPWARVAAAAAVVVAAALAWALWEPGDAEAPPAGITAAPAPTPTPAEASPAEPADTVAAAEPAPPPAAPAPKPAPPRKAEAKPAKPVRAAPAAPAAAVATGIVQMAVSPWGEVEVDGRAAGVTPPLSRLELPAGRHVITLRNGDFPPFSTEVEVSADQPVAVRHRFGS